MRKALPQLFLLLFSTFALSQVTYNAPTGSIASTFVTSMNLELGGSVTVYPNFGTVCYYPGPCGSSYASFSYSLPDGTRASFYPVSAHFAQTGSEPCIQLGRPSTCAVYTVALDPATSTDSAGKTVTASVIFNMHTVRCVQPRGTCAPKKVYDNGSLTVQ
jgi:hypothetical protein